MHQRPVASAEAAPGSVRCIFTDDPAGVRRASETVTAALVAAGYTVESVSEMVELDELISGFGDDLAELEIREGEHIVRRQLARFDRHRALRGFGARVGSSETLLVGPGNTSQPAAKSGCTTADDLVLLDRHGRPG
ncbi:MAG TPA: hypothetical protein VFY84_10320 [Jiangellales bacterium]|nr:hypothetical protein [Jiangellales bacterium]